MQIVQAGKKKVLWDLINTLQFCKYGFTPNPGKIKAIYSIINLQSKMVILRFLRIKQNMEKFTQNKCNVNEA